MDLDLPAVAMGEFKNITILESRIPLHNLSCTTTVYSFGKRILETQECQVPTQKSNDRYTYPFGCVNGFFTAFLNGIGDISNSAEVVQTATTQLSLIQVRVFEQEFKMQIFTPLNPQEEPESHMRKPLLVLSFEFSPGSGSVQLSRIRDFGILD